MKKKLLSVLTSAIVALFSFNTAAAPFFGSGYSYTVTAHAEATGINVAYRTQDEIRAYMSEHPFSRFDKETYSTAPSVTSPYVIGRLSDRSLENALNALNDVRFIAGLGEVTLNEKYNEYAQAASLVNCVNDTLSHYPTQPEDMPDNIYQLGAEGASQSNISYRAGYSSYTVAGCLTTGWMSDKSASNIPMVGHRRWCLNPTMSQTGFGLVSDADSYYGTRLYSAMYSFDRKGSDTFSNGVCWPAQNTPTVLFPADDPWSISMGTSVNASAVKVTLTHQNDGKVWTFSQSSSDGDFYVNNQGYGQSGCIIFRPTSMPATSDGDVYTVTVTGLSTPVSYTVNFFDVGFTDTLPGAEVPETSASTTSSSATTTTTTTTVTTTSATSTAAASATTTTTAVAVPVETGSAVGINVAYRTKEEIIAYISGHPFARNTEETFEVEPSVTFPYVIGRLSDRSLENALNALNSMRYIAGLQEVGLDETYINYAQASSLVNCVNSSLSHFPSQPEDMPDDIYKVGYTGSGSSNIAYNAGTRERNTAWSVTDAWMMDEDEYNIDRVGHRRWCLNPTMKNTGFGYAKKADSSFGARRYSAMYSFDRTNTSATEYGVCWPAQNTPTEFFPSNDPWSISMGTSVNASAVKVTLTHQNDGKTWTFSQDSADGDFYVNNDGYGQSGCIIFRPTSMPTPTDGDVYTVSITGLSSPVSYTVNFFDIEFKDRLPGEDVTTTSTTTTATTTSVTTTTTASSQSQTTTSSRTEPTTVTTTTQVIFDADFSIDIEIVSIPADDESGDFPFDDIRIDLWFVEENGHRAQLMDDQPLSELPSEYYYSASRSRSGAQQTVELTISTWNDVLDKSVSDSDTFTAPYPLEQTTTTTETTTTTTVTTTTTTTTSADPAVYCTVQISIPEGSVYTLVGDDENGEEIVFAQGTISGIEEADLINGTGKTIIWSNSGNATLSLTDGTYYVTDAVNEESIVFILRNGEIYDVGERVGGTWYANYTGNTVFVTIIEQTTTTTTTTTTTEATTTTTTEATTTTTTEATTTTTTEATTTTTTEATTTTTTEATTTTTTETTTTTTTEATTTTTTEATTTTTTEATTTTTTEATTTTTTEATTTTTTETTTTTTTETTTTTTTEATTTTTTEATTTTTTEATTTTTTEATTTTTTETAPVTEHGEQFVGTWGCIEMTDEGVTRTPADDSSIRNMKLYLDPDGTADIVNILGDRVTAESMTWSSSGNNVTVVIADGNYTTYMEMTLEDGILRYTDELSTGVYELKFERLELQLGDVNGDGLVDSVDASLILVHNAAMNGGVGTLIGAQLDVADVSGDGLIDSVDAALILVYNANLDPENPITLSEMLDSMKQ